MEERVVKILTHNGRFHADDVIACELLSILENGEVEIVRSRYTEDLNHYKWVVDVGKQYIPEHGRFDHHQEECSETWPGCSILLSSSGMVFLNLWKEILEKIGHPNPTWEEADMIYKQVFLPIDAHDNGQKVDEHNYTFQLELKGGCKGYGEGIKVGHVIADMNHDDVNSEKQDLRFADAMKYAFDSLIPVISAMMKTYRANKNMVEQLQGFDFSCGMIVLPKGGYVNSWVLHKVDPKKQLFFTIYEKKQLADGKKEWGFSAVQDKRFVNRIDLVKEDKEKYPNLIFIHKKLFCGSSTDLEEAIQICEDSIKQYNTKRLKKIGYFSAATAGFGFLCYNLFKN